MYSSFPIYFLIGMLNESDAVFSCLLYLNQSMYCIMYHTEFASHLNMSNVAAKGRKQWKTTKRRPADLRALKSLEKVQRPDAGDNIVNNYSHPCWVEDLSEPVSVISGAAAHLIPGCIGSVKHQ